MLGQRLASGFLTSQVQSLVQRKQTKIIVKRQSRILIKIAILARQKINIESFVVWSHCGLADHYISSGSAR